jgi:hypothetical protein
MKEILIIYIFLHMPLFSVEFDNFVYDLKSIYYNKKDQDLYLKFIKLNKNLKVYDATLYKNKIYSNNRFFPKIHLIYHTDLWSDWNNIKSRDYVDTEKIKDTAKKLSFSRIPYIIDIEHWNVHTDNDIEANKNIDKYIKVIKIFKDIRPDLKFGFYSVLPNRDYWSVISNDKKKIKQWNKINKRLKRLAQYVDVVCPSLYTFYDNIDDWKIYAYENIKKAKEYNKPIYAFIWPQFHFSNKRLKGKFLNKNFWKIQLDFLKNIDALVIWGGWNPNNKYDRYMQWNENKEWWIITKRFITSNSLNKY